MGDFIREFCVCAYASFVVFVIRDFRIQKSLRFVCVHLFPLLYMQ
jgi:hypothetical protein